MGSAYNSVNVFHQHNDVLKRRLPSIDQDFKSGVILTDSKDIRFPLFAYRSKIIDSNGNRVKLAFVNWSGGHLPKNCVGGLDCRPLEEIVG